MKMILRTATEDDAPHLARLYNYYIAETCVTFETELVIEIDMAQRVAETASIPH